jgi:hypothetical protein
LELIIHFSLARVAYMIQSRLNGPPAAASCPPIVDADISAVAAQAFLTDDRVGHMVALASPCFRRIVEKGLP